MTNVKIGIQTRSLRLPLRKAIATAARLGADGVEIDLRNELKLADVTKTAIRQFRKLLDDYGLRVAAVNYPTRRGYEELNELDRRLQGTQQAMKVAAELGARVVVNRAYGELPSAEDAQRTTLVQALESLAREGNRVGARFAAITGATPAAELAELLAEFPEGTIGVSLHPANLLTGRQTPLDALEALGPYVLHVHAADAVRDFGANRTVQVELGRGSADMPAVLAALEARDYTGWVTIERTDSPDPVHEIGNAVAYLRSLAY